MNTEKEERFRLKLLWFEFECFNPGKNSKSLLTRLLIFLLAMVVLWLAFKS